MPELLMLKGLPASGKSTFAKVLEKQGWVRVCKDDIRVQLGMSRSSFSRAQEYAVVDRRDDFICKALEAGKNVVSDDTNFGKKHEPRLRELAKRYGAEFKVEDFSGVPVELCIERDAKRAEPVGEKVIWGMAEQYLGIKKPETPVVPEAPMPYVEDRSLPLAVQCDLDGTLALHNGRGPYDYAKCGTDLVNEPVKKLLWLYRMQGYAVVYLSGREDWSREATEEWLRVNTCPEGSLFMRPSGDHRKDSVVKLELFNANVRGRYRIEVVLEDRDQMVKLWRDMGLACWQVNWGNF